MTRSRLTRRTVLASGAAVVASAIAGCGGETDDLCGDEPAIADESDVPTDRGTIPDDALGPDWPLVDYDPANTARSPAPGPDEGLARRWTEPVGRWLVVADGTLYGAVDDTDRTGLFAADARTGDRTWAVETVTPTGPPAVVDGTVVVGTDGGLRAFDAGSGERVWSARPRDDEPATTTADPQSPTVGSTTPEERDGRDPNRTGTPVIADGTVYATSSFGLHAYDIEDGTERWRRSLEVDLLTRPAVSDGTVVVATTPTVAVAATDGTERWRVEAGGSAAPAIRDGSVYLAGSKTVTAVSLSDGSEEWSWEGELEDFHSPTVTSERVFVGSLASEFGGANCYALDRASGEPEWCHYLGGADVPAPAAVDGRVYVATDEGYVQARDAGDGSLLWQYAAEYGFFDRPIVAGRTLYVPEDDGTVHALSA